MLLFGSATYKAFTATIDLVNMVIFDLVWQVNYDDYTTAVVLWQYCDDFHAGVAAKADTFTAQFDYTDVAEYESLYMAYLSAQRAVLEHFDKLARHNTGKNSQWLADKRDALCGEDVTADYATYIAGIRAEFAQADASGRESMRAAYDYTVPEHTQVTISCQGTNELQEDMLYFGQGVYKGNITLEHGSQLTIPAQAEAAIDGSLSMDGYMAQTDVLGALRITGDIRVNNYSSLNLLGTGTCLQAGGSVSGSNGSISIAPQTRAMVRGSLQATSLTVTNQGELEVEGDVSAKSVQLLLGNGGQDAVLRVGGDLTFLQISSDVYKPTGGMVIFDGTEQQSVCYLRVYDIEVTNPAGLLYGSDLQVYGHFDPHGSPLDTQGYRTWVYEHSTLAPGRRTPMGWSAWAGTTASCLPKVVPTAASCGCAAETG